MAGSKVELHKVEPFELAFLIYCGVTAIVIITLIYGGINGKFHFANLESKTEIPISNPMSTQVVSGRQIAEAQPVSTQIPTETAPIGTCKTTPNKDYYRNWTVVIREMFGNPNTYDGWTYSVDGVVWTPDDLSSPPILGPVREWDVKVCVVAPEK